MASTVASFCACSSHSGATRQSSVARTRGGKRDASLARSISQSGCAYEPTSDVGRTVVGCPMAGHGTTLRSRSSVGGGAGVVGGAVGSGDGEFAVGLEGELPVFVVDEVVVADADWEQIVEVGLAAVEPVVGVVD